MQYTKFSGYWGYLGYYDRNGGNVLLDGHPVDVNLIRHMGEHETCIDWIIQVSKSTFYKELLDEEN